MLKSQNKYFFNIALQSHWRFLTLFKMQKSIQWTVYTIFLTTLLTCGIEAQSIQLPQLNIDPGQVTVSGISSGAVMATQFHFAHSSEVKGAGMFAGVPYMCGFGGLAAASTCMLTPALVNVAWLITEANSVAAAGNIDSTNNIRGSKVFVFHGSEDSTVKQGSAQNIQQMYTHYGATIFSETGLAAEHGQPTHNYGAECHAKSDDFGFINNCNYKGAFEMLNYLYGGTLSQPNSTTQVAESLQLFDQSEFFSYQPRLSSMDTDGYLYVPTACKNGARCKLHIAFHGCFQYKNKVGDIFATKTGYMEAADLNDIVLLFPQTVAILDNPNGCWDWWGYLTSMFPTKSGNQILATYRMMKRLMGN